MSKEIPQPTAYDVDMFSGKLKDTRTKKQKDEDFARQFKQPLMFSQADIVQFGVDPHPLMSITDKTRLGLEMFDTRTDDDKERDLERAAQRLTIPMFAPESAALPMLLLPARCATTLEQEARKRERIIFDRHTAKKTAERQVLFKLLQENRAGKGSSGP
jgi:hypothetical protein